MTKTWEEIRDEVAGMLADGVPLEDITGKLEKLKNEYQKPLTNEEWFCSLPTEEKAKFLFGIAYMCSYCGNEAHSTKEKKQQCHFGKCCCQKQDWVKWLKQPYIPLKNDKK